MQIFWRLIDQAVTGVAYGVGAAVGLWFVSRTLGIHILIEIGGTP